jgi:four helix bundle protein
MMQRRPKMSEWLFQVADKSFIFAVDLIDLLETIEENNKSTFQVKQLFRYGTQIGAKVCRSGIDYTRQGFINCFAIAHRRAFETKYWLKVTYDAGYITTTEFEKFDNQLDILCRDMDISLKKIRLNKKILNLNNSKIGSSKLLHYNYN